MGFVLGFVLVSNCSSHDSGDLSFAPAEALDSLVLQDLPKTRQLQPKSSTYLEGLHMYHVKAFLNADLGNACTHQSGSKDSDSPRFRGSFAWEGE